MESRCLSEEGSQSLRTPANPSGLRSALPRKAGYLGHVSPQASAFLYVKWGLAGRPQEGGSKAYVR